jgi:hypothetical protein
MSLRRRFLLLIALLGLVGAGLAIARRDAGPQPPLGLFTSLPIYWNEAAALSGLLDQGQEPHWARGALQHRYTLRPLDLLAGSADSGQNRVDGLSYLLIAQPRPLAPQENLALDGWVQGGGRLLLFADPMLTAHSTFAIGDKRRPQDVAMLSPILARWGLVLEFDEAQPGGVHAVPFEQGELPVDLPGRLRLARTADSAGTCRLLAQGLAADCAIGRGHALVVADAALLDGDAESPESREATLTLLLDRAFGD